jgi:hypothetical protein
MVTEVQVKSTAVTMTNRDLRKFAWVMTGGFLVFGIIAYLRAKPNSSLVFAALSVSFLLFGAVLPGTLRPVYKVWMGLAHILGWVNTRVILSILFYLVLAPVSLVMRLFGRDVLQKRFDRSRTTYWHERTANRPVRDRYERLF